MDEPTRDLGEKYEQLVIAGRSLERFIASRMGYKANGLFDAEDICQDTFLECMARLGNGETIHSPKAYMRKVGERKLIKETKRLKRGGTSMDAEDVEMQSCKRQFEKFRADGKEEFFRFQLRLLIETLSVRDKEILRMFGDGWSSKEIGTQMSTSEAVTCPPETLPIKTRILQN